MRFDPLQSVKDILFVRNYRTVKYAFSFLFILVSAAGIAAAISSNASYVRLSIPENNIDAGTRFDVDVYAYAVKPVNAVDINIAFPAEFVSIAGIDVGQSVITLWTEEPAASADSVKLSGGTYKKGFVGEHKIATINVEAKRSGKADFLVKDVVMLSGDGTGRPVSVLDQNTVSSVYIYDENEVDGTIGAETVLVLITDIDGDGNVSLKDIASFMSSWYGSGRKYDFNSDGKMTFKDFSIILAAYFSG